MMDNTQKPAENPQVLIMEDSSETAFVSEPVENLVPNMNVSVPEPAKDNALISDEQYIGVLDEILGNIRDDRRDVNDYIDKFADLVINDGDATTSSKEALINLIKVKVDLQDKMLKAADLMTRLKLKNAFAYTGPHLNAMQQNNFNIGAENTNFDRKEIIRAINQAKKKKDDK